jgi:hypothetical protein
MLELNDTLSEPFNGEIIDSQLIRLQLTDIIVDWIIVEAKYYRQ